MDIIEIKEVGPIKHVKFELNRINVFMGQQGSGKSTIAKIISYCQWVEKRYILEGEFKYKFSEQFLEFHRIDENYFIKGSFIQYNSKFITLTYTGKNHKEKLERKTNFDTFQKTKNIYIPAERNFASSIPNLNKYNESNDNIMSFLYDWHDAKSTYSNRNPLSILDLDVSYYQSADSESDILTLDKLNKSISLQNASSGLQSIIPLMILMDYMTKGVFQKKTPPSIKEKIQQYLNDKTLLSEYFDQELANIKNEQRLIIKQPFEKYEDIGSKLRELNKRLDELELLMTEVKNGEGKDIKNKLQKYTRSKIIIEEPEQNLFPSTQRDLIYYILNKINGHKNHSLTLTTHSPYILYAINNCMMAYLISSKLTDREKLKLPCLASKTAPKKISIYEITNGKLKTIQQEDGLIGENFFDEKMKEVMNEFYLMLNHYHD